MHADLEGDGGGGGAGDDVAEFEGVVEVLLDEGSDFLGLEVELIGVAGGEGVGAEHDAAFHFGARETFAAAGGVEVDQVFGFSGAGGRSGRRHSGRGYWKPRRGR